jgi:hypothetical protein
MNERIAELIKQAGGIQYDEDGDELTPILVGKDLEKFAELIVAECLDVVAMRIYLGNNEMCRQECKALASEIKEHFGVAL